jgi:Methyltransferase domain
MNLRKLLSPNSIIDFFQKEPLYHFHMDRFLIKSPIIYRDSHYIVHIGGGPNRNHPKEVNLNIAAMDNVDIIGSAEALPLDTESVDVVISNAVLEHVQDLNAAVAEIERVLKPGGFLYVEIPFMQHYHNHDFYGVKFEDYRRFTKTGLVDLFKLCTVIDVGVCVGPTSTLFQILFSYLQDISSNKIYKYIISIFYNLLGNSFVWIDSVLPEEVIQNSRIPSGIYLFGRKKDGNTEFLQELNQPNSIFPKNIRGEIFLIENTSEKILIKINNSSSTTWLKKSPLEWGQVNIGLQKIQGDSIDINFKRLELPQDVNPGQNIFIEILKQELTGIEEIKIDIVIEGICWFEQYGNQPLRVNLA